MDRSILKQFEVAMDERPGLSCVLGLYKDILKIQLDIAAKQPVPPSPVEETVKEAFCNGRPLVTYVPLEVDFAELSWAFRKIAHALSKHEPQKASKINAITNHHWPFSDLVRMFWQNNAESILETATTAQVDQSIFSFLFTNALKSFYLGYAYQLRDLVADRQWQGRGCPVCGQEPLMAVENEDGQLQLTCSFCAANWLHQGEGCPVCGAAEINCLEIQDDTHILLACDSCRMYLKMVALAEKRDPFLVDILTLHLDHVAEEQGYARP